MPYTTDELHEILKALQRLFVSQGKHSDDKSILDLLDEIRILKFPAQAIIAGIRSLNGENLREIKLYHIKETTRLKIEPENTTQAWNPDGTYRCVYCRDTGMVNMVRHDLPGSYAFACICPTGYRPENVKHYQWNGQLQQSYKGKVFEFFDQKLFEEAGNVRD